MPDVAELTEVYSLLIRAAYDLDAQVKGGLLRDAQWQNPTRKRPKTERTEMEAHARTARHPLSIEIRAWLEAHPERAADPSPPEGE